MTDFKALGLIGPILKAVDSVGYSTPTPIQEKAIPSLLQNLDLLGIAQTGTGKTAAFSLPLLQKLATHTVEPHKGKPRALILAPTRELASQIADCINGYSKNTQSSCCVIFGGASIHKQILRLSKPVDIVVATPGRLLDLMSRGNIRLSSVETFILDEADRMLDMGFIHDVRKVITKLPKDIQTVLFSATMPKAVHELSKTLMKDPVRVEVTPEATTAERVDQRILMVNQDNKQKLLTDLIQDQDIQRCLVFTRTKHGADRVARGLDREGINSAAIHGNKSQNARERALFGFRRGNIRVLVATDIAARGIDVDGITHVINFDLPNEPESYVHRIGRTARAGTDGMAVSFCSAEEQQYLRDIEKTIRQAIYVDDSHPFHTVHDPSVKPPKRGGGGGGGGRGQRSGGGKPGGDKKPGGGRLNFKSGGQRSEGQGKGPAKSGRPRRP